MGLPKALFGFGMTQEEESPHPGGDNLQEIQTNGSRDSASKEQATERPPGFDWKESTSHLFLLSMFVRPRTLESITQPGWRERWREVLGEEPEPAIERLIDQGMIEPAGVEARLAHRYRVADLKSMLRERGLRVSGRKGELIRRLLEADPDSLEEAVADASVFECSVEGHEIAEKYQADESERRATMEERNSHRCRSGRGEGCLRRVPKARWRVRA